MAFQSRSTKAVFVECHWCSTWPVHSRIMACNLFSKLIQSLLRASWQKRLIGVDILLIRCVTLVKEVQCSRTFSNAQKKTLAGVERVISLANLLYHIFQSIDLATFYQTENGWKVQCKKELQPAGMQPLMTIFQLLTDVNVQHLIILDSSDYSIIKKQ